MYRLVRPLTQTVIRGAEEMKGIKNCFRRVKNRPGMFVFLALVTLLTTALEQYNPLTAKYAHFSTFSGLNFVDILCNWSASISAFFGRRISAGKKAFIKRIPFLDDVFLIISKSSRVFNRIHRE